MVVDYELRVGYVVVLAVEKWMMMRVGTKMLKRVLVEGSELLFVQAILVHH